MRLRPVKNRRYRIGLGSAALLMPAAASSTLNDSLRESGFSTPSHLLARPVFRLRPQDLQYPVQTLDHAPTIGGQQTTA